MLKTTNADAAADVDDDDNNDGEENTRTSNKIIIQPDLEEAKRVDP